MTKVFVVVDECGTVHGVYRTADGMLKAVTEMLGENDWDVEECGKSAAEFAAGEYKWFLSTRETNKSARDFWVNDYNVFVCALD
jgi:hypothetical protein